MELMWNFFQIPRVCVCVRNAYAARGMMRGMCVCARAEARANRETRVPYSGCAPCYGALSAASASSRRRFCLRFLVKSFNWLLLLLLLMEVNNTTLLASAAARPPPSRLSACLRPFCLCSAMTGLTAPPD